MYLKLKERAPLSVSAETLIANSPVFCYLVSELSQTQLEFDDFTPDIVVVFVDSLENGIVTETRKEDFREFHKLCMTFDVEWLIKHCQAWLTAKIDNMDSETGYEEKLFVFEECRYIMNKWTLKNLMHTFILKLLSMEEVSFISQYLSELKNVNEQQIDLMLKLGGSNLEPFVKIIFRNIEGENSIKKNARYLLQKLNLPFFFEQNERKYYEMLEKLSNLSELQSDDQKFLLQLSIETGKEVHKRKTEAPQTNTVFDLKTWKSLRNRCRSLDDLVALVAALQVTNLFLLTELLMIVAAGDTLNTETSKGFVRKLETCCSSYNTIKLSPEYIDMIITALKLSDKINKLKVTELLELMKDSEVLTSHYEAFCISLERSERIAVNDTAGSKWKYPFQFKHPAVESCSRNGKCGFIIKDSTEEETAYKLELTLDEADYEGTGLHYHEEVKARDIFMYVMGSAIKNDGSRVRVPARWRRWWFPDVSEGKIEHYCVTVSIMGYLVTK